MDTKIAEEVLSNDPYHLDVSDTNTDIIATADSTDFLLKFFKHTGATFTADGTVATFNNNHKAIINIRKAAYFAYFNGNDSKYKIVHEVSKAVIEIDLIVGGSFQSATMV